jgi:hypothetical protein
MQRDLLDKGAALAWLADQAGVSPLDTTVGYSYVKHVLGAYAGRSGALLISAACAGFAGFIPGGQVQP